MKTRTQIHTSSHFNSRQTLSQRKKRFKKVCNTIVLYETYRDCGTKQNADAFNQNDEDVEGHIRDLARADEFT
jgi:hypothetical protein